MRRLAILNIVPSTIPGTPSTITVGLDYTQLFHGKEWINGVGNRSGYWTYNTTSGPFPPVGTNLLIATTFEVVENATYGGSYTVYTKLNPADFEPSLLIGLNTEIRIQEAIPTGTANLNVGYITNISTYMFTITGEPNLLVLERERNDDRTIELHGRQTSGWGEVALQNSLRVAQCFAGPSAPTSSNTGQRPLLGQLWYNTVTAMMMVKPTALDINDYVPLNGTSVGSPGLTFRHIQAVANTSWVIDHNLNVSAPFIAEASFFVNTGGGPKPISPLDVTYNTANRLTATFSSAQSGYAIVRSAP